MHVTLLSPLQLCIQGSVLVFVVTVLRKPLHKALPNWALCALWLIVFTRFVVPWGLVVPIGLADDQDFVERRAGGAGNWGHGGQWGWWRAGGLFGCPCVFWSGWPDWPDGIGERRPGTGWGGFIFVPFLDGCFLGLQRRFGCYLACGKRGRAAWRGHAVPARRASL